MDIGRIWQRLLDNLKARYAAARKWTGRPGYAGFGLLGIGGLIAWFQSSCWAPLSATHDLDRAQGIINDLVRCEKAMASVLFAALVAFIGEEIRMFRLVRAAKGGVHETDG